MSEAVQLMQQGKKEPVSVFLQALSGKRPSRTPIWLMRQAGRYLPEYRKLREKNSMLKMVMTPELAAEVTLQPLKRFKLDAAIIFADILTPLIGMGINLEFKTGEGPCIDNPVRTAEDVHKLRVPDPRDNVAYTLDAIKLVVSQLHNDTPLIGFSGAPFTLSCYLIEGQSPGDLLKVKEVMYHHPKVWHALQEKLVPLVSEYLIAQADAGCRALQLFDSWLGYIGPQQYLEFVQPYLARIVERVKGKVHVPLVFFATGVAGLLPLLGKLQVDAFGIDWRISLEQAQILLGRDLPLQGNLDPQILLAPWDVVERAADTVLKDASVLKSHIFNLGHGVLPSTPVENVERLVELVAGHTL